MASLQEPKVMEATGLPTPGSVLADDFDQVLPDVSKFRAPVGLTTPVSPAFESFNTMGVSQEQDDVLYPDYQKASPSEKPLFESPIQTSPNPARARPESLSSTNETDHVDDPDYSWTDFARELGGGLVDLWMMRSHPGYIKALSNENRKRKAMQLQVRAKQLPVPSPSIGTPRDSHDSKQLASLPRSITHLVRKRKTYSCPSMTGPIIGMPAGSPDGPPQEDRVDLTPPDTIGITATADQMPKTKKRSTVQASDQLSSPVHPKKAKSEPRNHETSAQVAKRRNRQDVTISSDAGVSVSPAQQAKAKAHTRAHPTKAVDDLRDWQWREIEDFSPDVNMLDLPGAKRLRAPVTTPLDLSKEADREFLHPQELEVAANLRLPCQQYLINKRRIFQAKVKCIQEDKAFNKTACQQCTVMDVNKASKLWAAYNEVGWFDEHHFARFRI